jgi:hypothetical protein
MQLPGARTDAERGAAVVHALHQFRLVVR